ncbi:biotin--[acetyl-CoA-carboxylase] ligase [Candidatus Pelagibacter bacterium nBUS_49]|uniref:biotin--[acetyl-CoA-carboxylase] ligase n=1 Tax=Candidatus Pelagibacter bacterium nBUS_49 TaxID=3374196 RepID=UPI003EB9BC0F
MRLKKFKFKKVNSTNNTAIRIIKNSNFKFGMVTADTQLSGKGQYGKKWISNKGNLFVSFFHEIKNINVSLSNLTKINCLLVKKTIEKYYKKKILFKEPNDLLIDKKKISGILQEIISVSGNKFLIVGIGVNLIKSPKIKNYPTTNLSELINKPINKINFENELKVIFVKNLSRMYKIKNKVNKK